MVMATLGFFWYFKAKPKPVPRAHYTNKDFFSTNDDYLGTDDTVTTVEVGLLSVEMHGTTLTIS